MWGVITKIFAKNSSGSGAQSGGDDPAEESDPKRHEVAMEDTFVTKQAKQRASVKWLLSKAFNNRVPENLKEPFYRDHEDQEHLKPQIVGGLANAEIYCMALGNIYSDPNYHNLNHWAILQTLARKGVHITEQLTETTLIQTNPLKMSAHMAVIESIMLLYSKEVVTPDRVLGAVQRFSYGRYAAPPPPQNHQEGIFMWMSHASDALNKRIEQDAEKSNGIQNDGTKSVVFPKLKDMKDLGDGVGLSALISFYCPDELPWSDIKITHIPTVQGSLYNLSLVEDFCNRCLPVSIFHITPEDITYMQDSMKQNIVVFLADLFNAIEIHPAKCVRYPGMEKFSEGFPPRNEHGVAHKRNLLQTVMTPIPDLRSGLDDAPSSSTAFQVTKSAPPHTQLRKTNSLQHSVSEMSEDSLRRGSDDFVVHRGKSIPTLRAMMQDEPLMAARLKNNKERQNNDSKADERGEVAAGKPSNWEDSRKSSFAGRRSRRNSTSDDSQLTIENFGGSQDNINFIGRNPDKEVGAHVGRKISAPAQFTQFEENTPIRSTLQDARGSFQLGYDNGCEKKDDESEKYKLKRQLSSDDVSFRTLLSNNKENIIKDVLENESHKRIDFAELNQKLTGELPNVQTVYMQHGDVPDSGAPKHQQQQPEKKTSFAALPNTTTTWRQQSSNNQEYGSTNGSGDSGQGANGANSAQLTDVRLKLEEKRRMIENEKRRMEMAMNKQRQKVGKAAFLQAVTKGRGNLLVTPNETESNSNSAAGSESQSPSSETAPPKPQRPFTLKEINDDTSAVERKWLDDRQSFVEPKRTPDLENMDLEQYQQSLAQMNSSLNDIQSDIQRLASQQSQIQAAQQQSIIAQQQKQIQLLQQQQEYQQNMQKQQQFVPQQMYSPQLYQQTQQMLPSGLQPSASAPHIPQSLYQQSRVPEQPQFFLHDLSSSSSPSPQPMTPPVVPQRRTWAQQSTVAPPPILQQQPELKTWNKMQNTGGFVLHDTSDRYGDGFTANNKSRVQNGDEHLLHHSNSFTLSQQHLQQQQQQQQYPQYGTSHSTPSASPQHRNIHRQISQLLDDSKKSMVSLQQMDPSPLRKSSSITHAPIPAPPADDMEPQNISFIGNPDDQIREGLSRLNITSGSRTYRIPSPTRPLISRGAFHQQQSPPLSESPVPQTEVSSLENDPSKKKGFYIQFDNEAPKRPKPPLRTKKMSPKKERSYVEDEADTVIRHDKRQAKQLETELANQQQQERLRPDDEESRRQFLIQQERDRLRAKREASQERQKVAANSALIIEDKEPDPDLAERMKKRILLASLQRKHELEEAKAMKEAEAQARRDREKEKEEERARKKEEQVARRAAILEQYKLKKAMEEAEREGKVFDKSELMGSLKPTPKMRPKGAARPRPKTIHIDSGSVEMAEGMLQPSRGKKGSSSNLTGNNSTMRRDYYRGSQDSLADRSASSGMLYRDSPDDSRGMSPCHSANQTLGRRSSYKTSRDPSPAQVRGRPKLSNYQNFKGRKSSSLMNLYGSSTDQDSLVYRYGDTDSGLGRATPPRRAPSPGMGSMRHLPSPSGPGSLPGLMSKGRRMFDDGSSDISSTASSMMDYNGPRLYKQPATKSNRGIILNAVEYCVFPGVVNREAKKRVLEEISRSESKHFLILFRDAGCQFRALYSYCPDGEEIVKLYGTGPKQVNDRMFDKFFKYNSGGKCFSQIHTKHLTVTIDAFTIHNSLWQGKKVHLPNKKDMALVI